MVDITFTFTQENVNKFLDYFKDVFDYDEYVETLQQAGETPLPPGQWAKQVQIQQWKDAYKKWDRRNQAESITPDEVEIT